MAHTFPIRYLERIILSFARQVYAALKALKFMTPWSQIFQEKITQISLTVLSM